MLANLQRMMRMMLDFMQDGDYHAALVDARHRREQIGRYAYLRQQQ